MKIADAYVEISTNQAKFNRELKTLERSVKRSVDRMKRNFDRIGRGVSEISRTARWGFLGMTAAIAGVTYAAQKQEKAVAKLVQQLKNHGEATQENINALTGLAAELQKVTQFGDEQIIAGQAMLASFNLTTQQIKELTPHLLNLAIMTENTTGQQADLASVAKMVGVALGGQAGRLVQMGIAITDTQREMLKMADAEEKINILMQIFEENAGGLAEATGKTLAGSLSKAKNAMGDLAEELGFLLSPVIINATKAIVEKMREWKEAIRALTPAQKKLITQIVFLGTAALGAIGALGLFSSVAGVVKAAGLIIAGTFGLIASPLGLIMLAVGALALAWAYNWGDIQGKTKAAWKIIGPILKEIGKWSNIIWNWTLNLSGTAWDFLKNIWPKISDSSKTFWDWLSKLKNVSWTFSLEMAGAVWNFLQFVWPSMAVDAKLFWDWLEPIKSKVLEFSVDLAGKVWDWLKDVWPEISEGAKKFWKWLKNLTSKTYAWIVNIVGKFWDWLVDVWPTISGSAKKFWEWIKELTNKVVEWSVNIIGKAWKWIEEKWPTLKDTLIAFVDWLKGLPADMKKIYELVIKVITEPEGPKKEGESWAKKFWKTFKVTIEGTIETVKLKIEVMWNLAEVVASFFKGFWKGLTEKFEEDKASPLKIAKTIGDALVDGIKGIIIAQFLIWKWIRDIVVEHVEDWKKTGEYIGEKIGEGIRLWFDMTSPVFLFGKFWGAVSKWWEEKGKLLKIDWNIWGTEADAQTRNAIDSIDEIAETVEQQIGKKIPGELQLMSVALIASESSFDRNAKAVDRLGNEYKGLGQHGEAAIKDLKEMGLVINDINDPAQSTAATMAYFSKILDENNGDIAKSILIYKGWGKQLEKAGGNIDKLPKEAKKQLNIYIKLLKEFAGDSYKIMTKAGKLMVYGKSPGGIVGELEEGTKETKKLLDKMLGSMEGMTKKMAKIFKPIIGLFKTIFEAMLKIIEKFNPEAAAEIRAFVNDAIAIMEGLFDFTEKEADDLPDKMKPGLEKTKSLWQRFCEAVKKIWESIKMTIKTAMGNAVASILSSTQTMTEAFKSLQQSVAQAFAEMAVAAIAAGDIMKGAIAGVAAAFTAFGIRIRKTTTHFETAWGTIGRNFAHTTMEMGENIRGFTDMLETEFNRVGLAISKTIEDAQYKLEGLYQSQADLGASTREKLISELDKYYDYRVLKEMSLDELLAKSAETRAAIEAGTIQEVEESEAEQEARRKDRAISRLEQIENQYAREDELLRRKIALTEIEIKFLELKAEREANHHSARAKQLEAELDQMLKNYKESVKAYEDAEKAKQKATEDTTKTVKKETEEQTKVVKDAAEDETEDVAWATEDMADSWGDLTRKMQEEARRMKEAGRTSTEDIRKFLALSTEKMAKYWGQLTGSMISDLGKIPRRIDFDVVGRLHMPNIPSIPSGDGGYTPVPLDLNKIKQAWIDYSVPLWRRAGRSGEWIAQNIVEEWASNQADIIRRFKSAQIGIPYIPRTMPVIAHREEAILNPSQAREWRADKGAGGNTFNIRIFHTGDIRSDMDEERFMSKVASRISEKMRRP